MASFRTALVSLLENDAGVAALVGTKIGPAGLVSTIALPYVAYEVLAEERVRHFTAATTLRRYDVQITAYAATLLAAETLAAAIAALFERISTTQDSVTFIVGARLRQSDDFFRPQVGEGVGLYSVTADYSFWCDHS